MQLFWVAFLLFSERPPLALTAPSVAPACRVTLALTCGVKRSDHLEECRPTRIHSFYGDSRRRRKVTYRRSSQPLASSMVDGGSKPSWLPKLRAGHRAGKLCGGGSERWRGAKMNLDPYASLGWVEQGPLQMSDAQSGASSIPTPSIDNTTTSPFLISISIHHNGSHGSL